MDAVRRLLRLAVSDIQLIHDVEGSQRLPVGVRLLTIAATLAVTLASMLAGARSTLANQPPQVLTRVFFLDRQTQTVKWADLLAGERPQMAAVKTIAGFPTLDPAKQEIIGLEAAAGMLLVAVATNDSATPRGWVLVECGAYEEAHGDHSHWIYPISPRVRASAIDASQPVPTQLFQQAGAFVWPHQGGGFTRFDPANIASNTTADTLRRRAVIHAGGNGPSVAAITSVVAFAGWSATQGDDAGRVDITLLKSTGNDKPLTSVKLDAAPIQQMATTYNRVFVRGGGKLEWFAVPSRIVADAAQYPVKPIDSGNDATQPTASSAPAVSVMSTYGRYVAFAEGTGAAAAFHFIDASVATPQVRRVPLNASPNAVPGRMEIMRNRRGQPLALVFVQSPAVDGKSADRLAILELDPNRDGDWADAKLAATVNVGNHGENARHTLSVDADQRRAAYSNPGDGTIMIFSLDDRQTINGFKVGGEPTEVRAVGGRVSNH
jgi:hypothetical protein